MKRRSFIKPSLPALAGSAVAAAPSGAQPSGQEFYELRVYSLPAGNRPVLDRYLGQALIPALKRSGSGPVGVFAEDTGKDLRKVYVLIVHPSAEHITAMPGRLAIDEAYQ